MGGVKNGSFLILSGYFELMMYLQVTGKLNQFINIHYRYLAILSMIISLLLALVQLYFWVKQEPEHHHDDEHQHGLEKTPTSDCVFSISLTDHRGSLFPHR